MKTLRIIAQSLGLGLMLSVAAGTALAAETAVRIPAPAAANASAGISNGSDTAILAGGCFWGVQAIFQHTLGVTSAVSGYAGGSK